ncbi:LiaF transmembrane domain-containing protein [Hufsiella ginkgonis]|uniref:LiaF transmembrane domain-containing protein n=1 Tax=Hufsiella ginkgonis TaxID=2695274 RepID=A0A7K1XV74_9SPHI|nr:DUF5668 domain-containing protein [Hufsiella ginkgonis]MXV14880.1 hypothetical protein [Hufsiella ginkgonis]
MNALHHNAQSGRSMTGMVLVAAGSLLLAFHLGMSIPSFLISWPMLLIAAGLVSGAKHGFRKPNAWFAIGIGAFFLLKKFFFLWLSFSMLWPVTLIGVGVWLVVSTGGKAVN